MRSLCILTVVFTTAAAETCISSPLLQWAAGIPGAKLGPIRKARSGCGDGAGLYTSRAVVDGELLFSLPRAALIMLGDAIEDPQFRHVKDRLTAEGISGAAAALAGHLARLELNGASSAYISSLLSAMSEEDHML
eukprot:66799-Prymnesium_polylepis.1